MSVASSSDKAALKRHKIFANEVRTAPLAFWSMDKLARLQCVCCDTPISHISTYPFFSSGAFARQIIAWCDACGFGMVPGTSFALEEYYRREYAEENRRDRDLDPAEYFARMESDNPPKMLARYINRARRQAERIKQYCDPIGAMLDVGAGPGYALKVSGARNKFALEYDSYSNKYLDHIGAQMVDWSNFRDHDYDVVLMSHSLEHFEFHHVRDRLTGMANSLNQGGILYIEVPPGGLSWKRYEYKHEPHTLFFTPESLLRLGESLGLEVLFCGATIATYDKIHDREGPIYTPPDEAPLNDPRGSLTLIMQRQ